MTNTTESKKPRPNNSVFNERQRIEQLIKAGKMNYFDDAYQEFMMKYDWTAEVFAENGKYGLKNWDNTVLLPAAFDDFRFFSSAELKYGDRLIAMLDEKEGVVSADGNAWKWVLQPEYDFVTYPQNILAVLKDKKWGVYSMSKAAFLIPIECEKVSLYEGFLFCNCIGYYKKDGLYGVISQFGNFTAPIFNRITDDIDGAVKVQLGEHWGYIKEDNTFTQDEEEAAYFFEV